MSGSRERMEQNQTLGAQAGQHTQSGVRLWLRRLIARYSTMASTTRTRITTAPHHITQVKTKQRCIHKHTHRRVRSERVSCQGGVSVPIAAPAAAPEDEPAL